MGNHHRTDVFPSPVINVPLRLHFTTLWRNKKNKIQEKKTIRFLSLYFSLADIMGDCTKTDQWACFLSFFTSHGLAFQ